MRKRWVTFKAWDINSDDINSDDINSDDIHSDDHDINSDDINSDDINSDGLCKCIGRENNTRKPRIEQGCVDYKIIVVRYEGHFTPKKRTGFSDF
jgi:hypothetical protein